MTTTQSFASHNLSVDVDEDKMEMATSPYPVPHENDNDDDIDIELDDQREHSIEDNSMIDDNTENMEANLEQDDVIFYENEDELIDFDQDLPMDPDQSSYMHDPDANQEDNNQLVLPDSHDKSIEDASFEDAAIVEHETNSEENEMDGNTLQEEATNIDFNTEDFPPDDTFGEVENNLTTDIDNDQHAAIAEENVVETQASDVKDFATDGLSAEVLVNESEQPLEEHSAADDEPSIEFAEGAETNSLEVLTAELDRSTEQAENAAGTLHNDESQQSPKREASPIVLHPVTVRYNGEDCWLFPPLENTEARHVFLEDAALASEPFDRLLAALRSGLVNDQEMADHDELVFDIPVLGLHICEDSKHASLMNLSRVIDIYMMLSQNEGLTVFEPLYCELSTRVCLADQFTYVDDAAFVRRITYTDFVAEQAGSPEEITEEHRAETVEAGDVVVQEEGQVHAETLTDYNAPDDHENDVGEDDSGQQHPTYEQSEYQEVDEQTVDATETSHTLQPEQSEEETNALQTASSNEDAEADEDDAQDLMTTKPETGLVAAVEEEVETRQASKSPTVHQNELAPEDVQKEEHTEQSDETTVQVEPEADEDLFANDAVEPDGLNENVGVGKNGTEPESLSTHDDFDFDTWSDDEQVDTKADVSPSSLVTPSKGINGKRKLLDEEDDFLDLDISTPEPKRNRQS